jgi:hypothetical protein
MLNFTDKLAGAQFVRPGVWPVLLLCPNQRHESIAGDGERPSVIADMTTLKAVTEA